MSNKEDSPEKQDPRKEDEKKNVIKLGNLPEDVEKRIGEKTSGDEDKPAEGTSERKPLKLSGESSASGSPKPESESKDAAETSGEDQPDSGASKLKLSRTEDTGSPATEKDPPSEAAQQATPPPVPSGEEKKPAAPQDAQSAESTPAEKPTEKPAEKPAGTGAPKPPVPPRMKSQMPKPPGAAGPGKRPGPPPPPRKPGAATPAKKATDAPAPVKEDSGKGSVLGLLVDVIAAGVAVVFAYLLYTKTL